MQAHTRCYKITQMGATINQFGKLSIAQRDGNFGAKLTKSYKLSFGKM